jgi:DNA-binding PadR family transcriptional regulator
MSHPTSSEADLDTDARRFLPLTHLALHVLLSLAAGDGHGYGIIRDIEERSDGLVSPGTGSFYEIMRRMCEDGLIGEVEAPAESTDARRKYYGITALGREALRLETVRLTGLVREIRKLGVLGGPAA